ncbi:MAG: FHA domain-containing protein [Chloroflexi bacterium]|nr:MAG: FHA domain-containing protein [Chloroflexota bacterium]
MSSAAVVVRGADGSTVRIDRFPAVLGRYQDGAPSTLDCDLSALDPESKVSRQHVSLDLKEGRLVVTDLDSSNGSMLDGRRLKPNVPAVAGAKSVLRVGPVELHLELEGGGNAEARTPSPAATAPPKSAPPPQSPPAAGDGGTSAFVSQVFRAFADPAITHLVVEPGTKVRLRRAGEWGQTGSGVVTAKAWNALWEQLCRLTSSDPSSGGYVATLSNEAVLVEVFRPPLTARPVLVAQRRPTPVGLRNLAAAGVLDASSVAGLQQVVARGEGVLITGIARSGRTSMLEALIDEVPRGARIVVVERRPAIRTVSPQAVRVRSAAGHGEAAVEAALALSPDWIAVDDALPGAAAAATWMLPGGGISVILAARTGDAAAWRARAVDILAAHDVDRVAAAQEIAGHLPISVSMAPHEGRFRVEQIERLETTAIAN